MRRGLSAGRVQSAALKIICDRENEIKNFKPEEFWIINADFQKDKVFTAKLTECQGKKLSIDNEEQNNAVLEELKVELIISGNTCVSPRKTSRINATTKAIRKKAIQM